MTKEGTEMPNLDLSVIIPARNAERLLEDCLASVARANPREIIVVDGNSTDGTLDIARRYDVQILSDEGRGLPAARMLGAETATSERVVLLDADVVLPDRALAQLLEEFEECGYTALQAGLHSVGGEDYWGQALAYHHRTGRSKNWFGLVATIFDRQALLEHGFDSRFLSGEDIELRWRLQQSGARIGVSQRTIVLHRFEGGFSFALGQWLMDGKGLGRMVTKHGLRGALLLAMPLAGAARGIALALLRRQPRWVPYFLCYGFFNYAGMLGMRQP
jgi:glycosyltransferase involved in cell wall biosynthesis